MIDKYSHIIWDWNGTMFDDVKLCVDVGNNLFIKKSKPTLTVEKYKSIFTIPVEDYYIAAGFDFSKESFKEIGQEWMDEYEERKYECSLYNCLVEVLQKIKSYGVKQSVLSAYKQDNLNEMIFHFGLDIYMDNVVGLDNIYAESKLHLGKKLVKSLNNGKGKTLMIGDTIHDFEVAQEMKSDCILIASGHQTYEKLSTTGAKVYNSLSDLNKEF